MPAPEVVVPADTWGDDAGIRCVTCHRWLPVGSPVVRVLASMTSDSVPIEDLVCRDCAGGISA